MTSRLDDPVDAITDFNVLKLWSPKNYGILLCMWTGTIPAVAHADEPWPAGNWLTPEELNRRVVDYGWRDR